MFPGGSLIVCIIEITFPELDLYYCGMHILPSISSRQVRMQMIYIVIYLIYLPDVCMFATVVNLCALVDGECWTLEATRKGSPSHNCTFFCAVKIGNSHYITTVIAALNAVTVVI